jgi:hypothetical protein
MLIAVIGAAVVVVAALAVLTPTVIVEDDSPDVGLVAAAAPLQIAPPGFAPAPPGGPQGLPGCRNSARSGICEAAWRSTGSAARTAEQRRICARCATR